MKRSVVSGAAGTAVAAATLALLAAVSHVPYQADPGDHAVIRLSWRHAAAVVERCRPLTEAELARVPAHMRRDEVCEARAIPHRLEVEVDGSLLTVDTIRGAGAREDRPVYVFREFRVQPGERRLRVAFEPVESGDGADRGFPAAPPLPGGNAPAAPAGPDSQRDGAGQPSSALTLEVTLHLSPRDVALVTRHRERRELWIQPASVRLSVSGEDASDAVEAPGIGGSS